jgi:hypothetical protein
MMANGERNDPADRPERQHPGDPGDPRQPAGRDDVTRAGAPRGADHPDVQRREEREEQIRVAHARESHIGASRTARGDVVLEHTGFRLSWGAIFAGFVIAMVLQIVFALAGIAIGMAAWDTTDPAESLAIGAAIWLAVSMLVSLFVGGLATGRLAGILTPGDGALHGVVMWGVTMIVTFWLIAGGVRGLVGGALDIAQTAATSPAAAQVDLQQLQQQMEGTAREAQQRITPIDPDRATDDIAMGAGFALLGLGLGLLAAAGGAASTAKS